MAPSAPIAQPRQITSARNLRLPYTEGRGRGGSVALAVPRPYTAGSPMTCFEFLIDPRRIVTIVGYRRVSVPVMVDGPVRLSHVASVYDSYRLYRTGGRTHRMRVGSANEFVNWSVSHIRYEITQDEYYIHNNGKKGIPRLHTCP